MLVVDASHEAKKGKGVLMKAIAYQTFAKEQAKRVGGQRLFDAMHNQIGGIDEDVAEISWRVQGYTDSTEVYANVRADCERSLLTFSVDERDATSADGYVNTIEFTVLLSGERMVLQRGSELVHDSSFVDEALADFVRVAQPQMQEG